MVAVSLHGEKVVGSNTLAGPFCVAFAYSPCASVGSLAVKGSERKHVRLTFDCKLRVGMNCIYALAM